MKKVLYFFIFIMLFQILFTSCRRREKNNNRRDRRVERTEEVVTLPQRSSAEPRRPQRNPQQSSTTFTGPEIFEKYNSAVFMVYTSSGWAGYQGSGFFVSSTGIGVSNYHVFKGTTKGYETIKLSDGSTYKIRKVIAANEAEDVIIFQLETNKRNFNYIPMAANSPRVGEKVYAIGSPLGYENTFSSGEISQLRGNNMLQISVPIDHGSSGGALINEYGELIGITSAGRDDSGANLNFAIDIKVIKKYLK